MSKFHYYFVDRDEREVGGKLIRERNFDTWLEAKKYWDEIPYEPIEKNIGYWLGKGNLEDPDITETMACKPDYRPEIYKAMEKSIGKTKN